MDISRQSIGAAQFLRQTERMESRSGTGSTLAATEQIRAWLPGFIDRYDIDSIADIPCGDCHWISQVNLLGVDYTGYDLSPELIEANRWQFPNESFRVFNAITDVPDKADLILCRDFLVHLTFEHALDVLSNFRKSGSQLVAMTTFPGALNQELPQAMPGWGWRVLDVEADPFCMGAPLDGVREVVAGERWERWARVYRL